MLSDKIEKALNKQINAEIYSSYLYLSMCAYFDSVNLTGLAKWMHTQVQEELFHAMKFFDYVNERGGRVILKEIDKPKTDWDSPLDAFKDAFKHEQKVTKMINELVDLAISEQDHATNNFLQWFVEEQVEEEASVDEVVQKLKLIGTEGGGLFMLDRELGMRTFTMPAKN